MPTIRHKRWQIMVMTIIKADERYICYEEKTILLIVGVQLVNNNILHACIVRYYAHSSKATIANSNRFDL